MKTILVLNANPKTQSLCASLAEAYVQSARETHTVEMLNIRNMQFEIDLHEGYAKEQPLEPDLRAFQDHIARADHIVIVSPVWWGTVPAKFKGAIDRAFVPGFAFKYIKGKRFPVPLLPGKTAELIVTLDTPPFWYRLVHGNVIARHLSRTVLGFSGIKTKRVTYFGPVISANENKIKEWIAKAARLGQGL